MRKTQFNNGGYYHICNRGVDKREIFIDKADRRKFLLLARKYLKNLEGQNCVQLHAYCLMGNHFHLMIEQSIDGGVSNYMLRLSATYAMYFNKKYKRKGRLFESEYVCVPSDAEGQLAHTIRYIHLNPIKYQIESGEQSTDDLMKTAKNYRWSDCSRYLAGKGSLNKIFSDISYRAFFILGIKWGKA